MGALCSKPLPIGGAAREIAVRNLIIVVLCVAICMLLVAGVVALAVDKLAVAIPVLVVLVCVAVCLGAVALCYPIAGKTETANGGGGAFAQLVDSDTDVELAPLDQPSATPEATAALAAAVATTATAGGK